MRYRVAISVLTAAALTALGGSYAADAAQAPLRVPAPTGRWPVGTHLAVVTDKRADPFGTGRRQIALQVWFPLARAGARPMPYLTPGVARVVAGAEGIRPAQLAVRTNAFRSQASDSAAGSFPLVLFSPGYGEPHAVYTALLEDLASHGFVVVALDHTHETVAVDLPAGTVVQSITFDPRNEKLKRRVADAREDDVAGVLAALRQLRTGGALPQSADASRVGIFGHSLGGRTAVGMLAHSSALRCGADLDGSLMQLPSSLVVRRPLLVLTGVDGAPTIGAYWPSARGERWWFQVGRAAHLAFSDWVWLAPAIAREGKAPFSGADAGGIAPARAVGIVRDYLAAFFGSCLKGGSRALLDRSQPPYPQVSRRR